MLLHWSDVIQLNILLAENMANKEAQLLKVVIDLCGFF